MEHAMIHKQLILIATLILACAYTFSFMGIAYIRIKTNSWGDRQGVIQVLLLAVMTAYLWSVYTAL